MPYIPFVWLLDKNYSRCVACGRGRDESEPYQNVLERSMELDIDALASFIVHAIAHHAIQDVLLIMLCSFVDCVCRMQTLDPEACGLWALHQMLFERCSFGH